LLIEKGLCYTPDGRREASSDSLPGDDSSEGARLSWLWLG
jgi:hypothetical protein